MFYNLHYKSFNRPARKTIVKARSKEEAIKMVNDPNEIGKTAEVKEIKVTNKIPKDWNVTYRGKSGFPITGNTKVNIDLDNVSATIELFVGGKKTLIRVKDILSASKPSKDKNVMGKRRVFY